MLDVVALQAWRTRAVAIAPLPVADNAAAGIADVGWIPQHNVEAGGGEETAQIAPGAHDVDVELGAGASGHWPAVYRTEFPK